MAFKILMEIKGFKPEDELYAREWVKRKIEETAKDLRENPEPIYIFNEDGDLTHGTFTVEITISEKDGDLMVIFEVLKTTKEPDRDVWAIGSGLPEDD